MQGTSQASIIGSWWTVCSMPPPPPRRTTTRVCSGGSGPTLAPFNFSMPSPDASSNGEAISGDGYGWRDEVRFEQRPPAPQHGTRRDGRMADGRTDWPGQAPAQAKGRRHSHARNGEEDGKANGSAQQQ